ncbi:MAG: hypothetical protein M3O15_05220 [Acidobacteriota bacterium]|nr:hypothetical protein [Acidobacteriota bacterium]
MRKADLKLRLTRETLRDLNQGQLREAAGQTASPCTDTCDITDWVNCRPPRA